MADDATVKVTSATLKTALWENEQHWLGILATPLTSELKQRPKVAAVSSTSQAAGNDECSFV